MGNVAQLAWLASAVCFILSLGGLSQHETARRGNWFGIAGISIAIFAAFFSGQIMGGQFLLILALVAGALGGSFLATRVEMTAMPQLVAILHSFVGLAAVLVGLSVFLSSAPSHVAEVAVAEIGDVELDAGVEAVEAIKAVGHLSSEDLIHKIEIFLGIFIGGITFTGSVIAWGKLEGKISSTPLMIPGRHLINLAMLLVCLPLGYWFLHASTIGAGVWPLLIMLIISFVFGAHLVMAIGGADMPVVVSMLNSYSGWAAAATGFMLSNDLLIITGALVGSSGAILSYIMCHAMNRSFLSVILGGFGTGTTTTAAKTDGAPKVHTTTNADEVAASLKDAREVIVVPGYGMAVAQAQHPIREICEVLQSHGTRVRFAIHPVAGRLPGHMNVLLAEAKLSYDLVLEMDEINEDFPNTDVVLVVGANDIVNPGALDDPSSPIYGMPVLEAWKANEVVVFKRSMGSGYSGVDNPLFYFDNTDMLLGDAKKSSDEILQGLRRLSN